MTDCDYCYDEEVLFADWYPYDEEMLTMNRSDNPAARPWEAAAREILEVATKHKLAIDRVIELEMLFARWLADELEAEAAAMEPTDAR